MNTFAIPPLITCIILFCIGIFVFLKNRTSKLNILFSLLSFSMAAWLFGYTNMYLSRDASIALKWARMGFLGIIFIPIFAYHFITSFLNLKRKFVLPIIYALTIPSLILSQTNFIYSGIKEHFWGYYPTAGKVYIAFLLMFYALLTRGALLLYSHLKKESGIRREQMKYMFLAFGLGTFGIVDYLIKYPFFDVYPFGYACALVFNSLIAVAIVRYRLLDINIALTRAGIFAVVYTLVLGLPFVVIKWLKPVLIPLLGENWWIAILVFGMALASAGPFIYLFLQHRAEAILLKEQRRYQQALRELSKTLTRIRDLDKLLKAIVLTVIEQVKVSFAAVYLKDEEYKSYRLKHYFPLKSKSRFQEFIPLDDSLIKVLYEQKRPLHSEEIGSQDKLNLDSGLVVPCFIAEGNLLGFLCLGHKPNNQMYTQDDLIVFETLSYSTSLAIENSQFWKEIEEHQRQARIQEMDLFSYSLAHEIDNPMNNIKTVARYLKDYLLKELNLPQEKQKEIEAVADSILSSQERVSGMVKAIEEFGKPTTGEFSPLKLEDVLKNYLDLYLPEFKYHGIYFTKEIPEKIPYIRGVKQELMQILANFSNNSIHALLATKEKKIHLKVEVPNQDWIRISFSDNGYGITEEKLRSIFAPFVTTKASTEGKGMGLYTIRRIIERHKGRVWAESEGKGKGATFFVELPIAKDITEEDFKKEDRGKRLF